MRNVSVLIGIGALILIAGIWMINRNFTIKSDTENSTSSESSMAESMQLTSSVFEHTTSIPSRFTCDGNDISPPLSWSNVPDGTKSLVLIMDDPDAGNTGWVHWVVFNMPPTLERIEEGKEPEGVAGNNSWGRGGWGGPCPPTGTHRYFFKLYALDVMLDLPLGASKSDILAAMEGHMLAEAELIGKYKRE